MYESDIMKGLDEELTANVQLISIKKQENTIMEAMADNQEENGEFRMKEMNNEHICIKIETTGG